jgi:hypothetical protein
VNQTCRPLLAKIPKTAWERRKFPTVTTANTGKTLGKRDQKFAKISLVGFWEIPKIPS